MFTPRRSRVRRLLLGGAALVLYGLVVVSGPFLHHDFACHARSRTHCTTCTFNLTAKGIHDAATVQPIRLPEVGSPSGRVALRLASAPLIVQNDRSPPA